MAGRPLQLWPARHTCSPAVAETRHSRLRRRSGLLSPLGTLHGRRVAATAANYAAKVQRDYGASAETILHFYPVADDSQTLLVARRLARGTLARSAAPPRRPSRSRAGQIGQAYGAQIGDPLLEIPIRCRS
jgi:hypothetical protein